jgi:energy-coupling factor transport system substrate-specific component
VSAVTAPATVEALTVVPRDVGRVVGPRSAVTLTLASLVGLVAFLWPLFTTPRGAENTAHAGDAPLVLVVLLPLLLAIVVAEIADGLLDAKAVALLGVLAAVGAALRLPGGVAGFEPMFFVVVVAGRALGRGFGFVLGALTLFASALLTAGVGPWLPFQMLGTAWVGFFAGCLPRASGRRELVLLAGYAAVAGLGYGLLLNMWFWPFAVGRETALSFVPGAPVADNLQHFLTFHLATSLGFDAVRAVTNLLLVLVVGRPLLVALRRGARRATFTAPAHPARSQP